MTRELKEKDFPHIARPFVGMDIERWRTTHGLSLDDATYALGIASYNNKLNAPGHLDYTTELLMRLYNENPGPGVWPQQRITLPWLFNELYSKVMEQFAGTEHVVTVRVDLQARFAKLFGRSRGRAYRWLDDKETDASLTNKTQEGIQAVLSKLSQLQDPAQTLERLSVFIWKLRGEDIDISFPIPTLKNPPLRKPRGRKPGSKIKPNGPIKRVIATDMSVRIKDASKLKRTSPLKKSKASVKAKPEKILASSPKVKKITVYTKATKKTVEKKPRAPAVKK